MSTNYINSNTYATASSTYVFKNAGFYIYDDLYYPKYTETVPKAPMAEIQKRHKWYKFNEGNKSTAWTFLAQEKQLSVEPLFVKAFGIADRAHEGQKRKDGRTDYIIHPAAVAMGTYIYLADKGNLFQDKALHAARVAVLHDVIEDAKDPAAFAKEILDELGSEVLGDVLALSNLEGPLKALPRSIRKIMDAEKFRNASPIVKLIKLTDRIHNLSSVDPTDGFICGPKAVYALETLALLKAISNSPGELRHSELHRHLPHEEAVLLYPRMTWLLSITEELMRMEPKKKKGSDKDPDPPSDIYEPKEGDRICITSISGETIIGTDKGPYWGSYWGSPGIMRQIKRDDGMKGSGKDGTWVYDPVKNKAKPYVAKDSVAKLDDLKVATKVKDVVKPAGPWVPTKGDKITIDITKGYGVCSQSINKGLTRISGVDDGVLSPIEPDIRTILRDDKVSGSGTHGGWVYKVSQNDPQPVGRVKS